MCVVDIAHIAQGLAGKGNKMKERKLSQAQKDMLNCILTKGGVVASSDWTNGTGRYVTRRAVPRHCQLLTVTEASRLLKGSVRKAFLRLTKARPRVEKVVACVNLRAANRELKP